MSVELSNQSIADSGVQDALREIQACHAEMQTFLDDLLDRLEGLTEGVSDREASLRQAQRESDSSALDDQIERLAALTAELADSIAQQKKLAAEQNLFEAL